MFASRTAGRQVSRRPCPRTSCLTFSLGFRPAHLRSIALPHGRCWLRWPFYGRCSVCCRLGTPHFGLCPWFPYNDVADALSRSVPPDGLLPRWVELWLNGIWIFRHQNSVLAAQPVGQVDFSVCRACQGLFYLPTASKRECVSQGFTELSVC